MVVRKQSKRDPALRWFDEARFGMFVHFGLYALLGRGEWVMYHELIARRKYERLMGQFNPDRFSADAWLDLAEQAGARYLTVTAKHHDGFCLFDSKLTDYKITNTPFGRDLIGELAEACHRREMPLILYYSQPDWHHRNYLHKPEAFKDWPRRPVGNRPNWRAYQRYLEGQVTELVTNYGKIDGIWFDGSHKSEREWRGRRLYELIKLHQPGAVVNDRARWGDFLTPERSLPGDLTGFLFEACESVLTESWGYHPQSPLFSAPHLIGSLSRTGTAGGNYLLNVGPAPDGSVPAGQAARLAAVGEWLRRNGEAVYDTDACPLDTGSPDIRATRGTEAIYLHLLEWPRHDRLLIPGVRSRPRSVELLGGGPLPAALTPKGLEISGLPAKPVESSVNVIRLQVGQRPHLVVPRPKPAVQPAVDLPAGRCVRLGAEEALLGGYGVKGGRLRVRTPRAGADCISGWHDQGQWVSWRVRSAQAQHCQVGVWLSCPAPYEGSRFVLEAAGQRLHGTVKATAHFDGFQLHPLGGLDLPRGQCTLTLRVRHMPYGYVFADVRAVEIDVPSLPDEEQPARA